MQKHQHSQDILLNYGMGVISINEEIRAGVIRLGAWEFENMESVDKEGYCTKSAML